MMYRSQLSLKFLDEKLYLEFIKPLIDSKELSPLIIKLLASYYYSDATKEAVDGVTIESLRQNEDYITDDQKALREKIADIRASAQMLNMFVEDTKSTLEEGMEYVNNIAKATGGQARTSEGDITVPRISMVGLNELAEKAEKQRMETSDVKYAEVKEELSEVKSSIALILQMLQAGNNSVSIVSQPQVLSPEPKVSVKTEPIVEEKPTIIEAAESVEHTEPSEGDRTAGFNRLSSLISSGGVGGF